MLEGHYNFVILSTGGFDEKQFHTDQNNGQYDNECDANGCAKNRSEGFGFFGDRPEEGGPMVFLEPYTKGEREKVVYNS